MTSWIKNNTSIDSLVRNGKTIDSIIRDRDNSIIYEGAIVDSITLTSNKSILSYADHDSCILTATVLDDNGNGLANKEVSFYIVDPDSGEVLSNIGTAVTNENGEASVYYSAKGAGDLNIKAEVPERSLVSETYAIEDCTKYDTTEYTSNQNVQIALPTGDFEISTDLFATTNNASYPQLYIGTGLNTNYISIGQMIREGNQGWEFKKNNTRLVLDMFNTAQSYNTYYNVKLTRVGNDYTLYWNNQTLTYTNSTIEATYLFLIYLPNGKSKNLKIKPL